MYKNGIIKNAITSADLDCYFVQSPEGLVPIGYYKDYRPAEAVAVTEKFLENCKAEAEGEIDGVVEKLNLRRNEIAVNFGEIQRDRHPSVFKVVVGFILIFTSIFTTVFSAFFAPNILMLVITVALPAVSGIVSLVLTIKEMRLLSAKKATARTVQSVMPKIDAVSHNMKNDIDLTEKELQGCARKGSDARIAKNSNGGILSAVSEALNKADVFSKKTKSQRNGLPWLVIILILVLCIACTTINVVYLCINISKFIAQTGGYNGNVTIGDIISGKGADDDGFPGSIDPPKPGVEEPKVSSYYVYKSDATWYEAMQDAESMGGYLVSVNDKEEFDRVCALADENGLYVFWVGATRSTYDDWHDVYWLDGEKISYTKWFTNEPSYISEEGEEEKSLMVFKVNGTWYFNDSINDVSSYYKGKMGYIVEIEE